MLPFQRGELIGGRFQIDQLVNASALSFVVSALDTARGTRVALKFVRPTAFGYEALADRFADAARSACRLASDFVVRVLGVSYVVDDAAPFMVMEWLDGQSLRQLLIERGPQSAELVATLGMQACAGLAAAHAEGMAHRGIHPNNLFVAHDAQSGDILKVLDFGISQAELDVDAIGSLAYLSPEQMRAKRQADARTDIWSLGCVLYELLSGKSPFDAPSPIQVCAAVLEAEPRSLTAANAEIPSALEAVVMRCLEKDPQLRYQSVDELAQALEPFAARDAFEDMPEDTEVDRASEAERLSDVGLRLTPVMPEQDAFPDDEHTTICPAEEMRAKLLESMFEPLLADQPPHGSAAQAESSLQPSAAAEIAEEQSSANEPAAPTRATARPAYLAIATITAALLALVALRYLSPLGQSATDTDTRAAGSAEPPAIGAESAFGHSATAIDAERARAPAAEVHEPPATAIDPTPADAPSAAGSASGAVAAVIRSHSAVIQACFDRARADHPDLHARLLFHATLDQLGNVTNASIDNQLDNGARLKACILANARRWKFPGPAGGSSGTVSYTFVF